MQVDNLNKPAGESKPESFRVKSTKVYKLKDKPSDRQFLLIDLKKAFGFMPEEIIVAKELGQNNHIRVLAVMTPEEIVKADKILAGHKAEVQATLDAAQKKADEFKKVKENKK